MVESSVLQRRLLFSEYGLICIYIAADYVEMASSFCFLLRIICLRGGHRWLCVERIHWLSLVWWYLTRCVTSVCKLGMIALHFWISTASVYQFRYMLCGNRVGRFDFSLEFPLTNIKSMSSTSSTPALILAIQCFKRPPVSLISVVCHWVYSHLSNNVFWPFKIQFMSSYSIQS